MPTDWSNERVLVTGGSGMIGANLVARLIALGSRPFVLARDPARGGRLTQHADRIVPLPCDIADAAAVSDAVAAADLRVVFHLASSYFNPPDLPAASHMRINALGAVNLCEAVKHIEGVRLVNANTCAIYAGGSRLTEDAAVEPQSMYGVTKAAAGSVMRHYGRGHGLSVIELRLFTPFGPWESTRRLIPSTILSALAGRDMRIGDGRQQRDFVYMDDVVEALLLAAGATASGVAINIGGGVGRSIRDVACRVLELMGDPVGLVVGNQPARPDEIWEISADIGAAERLLGWRPRVAFDDGLSRTIDWFRQNPAFAAAAA